MASSMEKKTREQNPATGEDRLSSLPDNLLIDIVNLLPIKSAAATSALSRSWKHLWTNRTCINIDFDELITRVELKNRALNSLPSRQSNQLVVLPEQRVSLLPKHVLKFCDTVGHILRQLTSPKVTTFAIRFTYPLVKDYEYHNFSSFLQCWVRLVCSRNIEEIEVEMRSYPETDNKKPLFVCLPSCLFQSPSLVKLVLRHAYFNFKESHCVISLPKLKTLEMDLKSFEEFHRRLLASTLSESFPVLEDLRLRFSYYCKVNLVKISSRSLKSLFLDICGVPDKCKMVIDAPSLEHIKICGSLMHYEFAKIPTKLVRADINTLPRMGLLQGISCVRSLHISDDSVSALRQLNILNGRDEVPLFRNLVELHLVLYIHSFNHANLQIRTLPVLLLSKLEIMTIAYPKGTTCDDAICDEAIDLLRFILSNALVLERLSVSVTHGNNNYKHDEKKERIFCETLFMLQKSSINCHIEFKGKLISESSSTFKNRALAYHTLLSDVKSHLKIQ